MADGGGKDPISSTAGTLLDGIVGLLKMGLVGAALFGLATGLVPKTGNIFSVLDVGSVIGAIGNNLVSTFTSVFMPGDSMQKLRKVDENALPAQRLSSPSNVLPTSSIRTQAESPKTQTLNVSGQAELTTYVDTNGKGFVSIEEIAAQNKTRKP